jgi:hypothetical protein
MTSYGTDKQSYWYVYNAWVIFLRDVRHNLILMVIGKK